MLNYILCKNYFAICNYYSLNILFEYKRDSLPIFLPEYKVEICFNKL